MAGRYQARFFGLGMINIALAGFCGKLTGCLWGDFFLDVWTNNMKKTDGKF